MGRIAKGTTCSVSNCSEIASRSLSLAKIKLTGLRVAEQRRVYLCKEHYKEYKKKSRSSRQVDKWRWGT